MKIIVTGGAGFIGSHITDAYIKARHRVAVIDSLTTGSRKNINPKAKFYRADIRDGEAIRRIFQKERPEVVNHHAAIAEVARSLRDPIPTLEVNVLGTANLLVAFGEHGRGKRRKFIFSSTGGALYGDPKRNPVDEMTAPDPLSPYGISKLMGENAIKFYGRHYGFDHFIFRYANIYGPRQNPKGEAGVVAIFGDLMRKGGQPIIFGDGSKARDYVFVDDVVAANLAALRRGRNVTVSIGHGKLVTDLEIFRAIAREVGFTGKPQHAPYRKGEVYRVALDARRARKILKWKPKTGLKKGISKALRRI